MRWSSPVWTYSGGLAGEAGELVIERLGIALRARIVIDSDSAGVHIRYPR